MHLSRTLSMASVVHLQMNHSLSRFLHPHHLLLIKIEHGIPTRISSSAPLSNKSPSTSPPPRGENWERLSPSCCVNRHFSQCHLTRFVDHILQSPKPVHEELNMVADLILEGGPGECLQGVSDGVNGGSYRAWRKMGQISSLCVCIYIYDRKIEPITPKTTPSLSRGQSLPERRALHSPLTLQISCGDFLSLSRLSTIHPLNKKKGEAADFSTPLFQIC